MRDNVISFRFTDDEVKALQAFQVPEDKSPSQTAARLMRGMIAGIVESSTVSSTPVDIKSLIASEVRSHFSQLEAQLEELRGKLKAR